MAATLLPRSGAARCSSSPRVSRARTAVLASAPATGVASLASAAILVSLAAIGVLWLVVARMPAAAAAEERDPRVAWLAEHAIALRSIDPADDDLADLEPLRKVLEGARIVALGEPSHGDGAAFLAKTRLIRFLHERMGFDVLAFESGLYDCREAWKAYRAGEDGVEAGSRGIFGIWTRSAEVRPLLEYLGAQARGERPLGLCGFDCQLTASASRERLEEDLAAKLGAVDPALLADPAWEIARATLAVLLDPSADLPADRARAGREAFAELGRALGSKRAVEALAPPDLAFWRQLLESLSAQVEVHRAQREDQPEGGNLRDEQMARNLIWLAREAYPERKIVVWAATFHLARNLATLDTRRSGVSYERTVTMGRRVAEALGAELYTLGITAYEGAVGRPWTPAAPLAAAEKDSLEDLGVRAGLENAWIDLRGAGEGGAWLRRPLVARPLGYSPMKGDWSQVVDGMLFLRRMTPSTNAAVREPASAASAPAGEDLLAVLRASWRRIRAGEDSGNVWAGKWTFRDDYEAWRKASSPGVEGLRKARREVTDWLAEEGGDEPRLAWRIHDLLAVMAEDAGDAGAALLARDAALGAYPEREDADPAKHSFFQHLVNDRARLVWDRKGWEAALEDAARRLESDRRFRFFFADPWRERLLGEGRSREWKQVVERVRAAYEKRAKRIPEQAEEARRFAAALAE